MDLFGISVKLVQDVSKYNGKICLKIFCILEPHMEDIDVEYQRRNNVEDEKSFREGADENKSCKEH